MKTATLPPLRVTQSLRGDAESVLREGETLSAFLEEALRANIARRRLQAEFIARGLAAGEQARRDDDYVEASAVLRQLDTMLAAKRPRPSRRP